MAFIQERPDRPLPYTVRWREAGKERRQSFRTKGEARACRAEKDLVEARVRRGEYVPPAVPRSFRVQAAEWLQLKADQGRAPHYLASLRSVLDVWVLPALGDLLVTEVGPGHLEDLLAAVSRAGRGNDTRVRVKGAVVGVLDHAVARGVRGPHYLGGVRAGAPKRKRVVEPYTDEQVEALVAALDRESDRLVVLLMGTMGLRPSEALGLRLRDFDGENLVIDAAKTGRRRVLTCTNALRSRLRAFVVESGPGFADHLFRSPRTGTQWTADAWRKRVWRPAAQAAGLGGRPYDLRHTCASKLIARGASPTDVADWMGHSVKMTLEVYAHLFPGRKAELARLLD